MTDTIFKIKNTDGLFSTGDMDPDFTKKGKMWKQLSHVKCHLGQVRNPRKAYEGCEIVGYELQEVRPAKSLDQIFYEMENAEALREQEQERKRTERVTEDAKRTLAKLQEDFPELFTKTKVEVFVIAWEESERGWGTRPDGISIHKTKDDAAKYIASYWRRMNSQYGSSAPDEYERPVSEKPRSILVEESVALQINGFGKRVYRHDNLYNVITR